MGALLSLLVIAGPVPAISARDARPCQPERDGRDKRVFTPVFAGYARPRHFSKPRKAAMDARIIALEEHFWTPELIALRRTVDQVNPRSVERLGDLGSLPSPRLGAAGTDLHA